MWKKIGISAMLIQSFFPVQKYEEVIIPTPITMPMRSEERLRVISELDPLARGSFPVCHFLLYDTTLLKMV